jgi:aspartate kinase
LSAFKSDQLTQATLYLFLRGRKKLSLPITVMKFGGTSLADTHEFEQVVKILRACSDTAPVAVVSAMSGVTDALNVTLNHALGGKGIAAELPIEEHFERHLKVASEFGPTAMSKMRKLLDSTRSEINRLLEVAIANRLANVLLRDVLMSYGEILSAQLLNLVLNENGLGATYVDARRCLITNEEHGNATPLTWETNRRTQAELKPLLESKKLPVLGGFIGATRKGLTTTLGRGSSNYTATIVSSALNARETQIWTDVNGVQTADPRLVGSARTVPHLSYDEAEEIARLGAKVLYQRMFQPLRAQNIPVRICSSYTPDQPGTLIGVTAAPSPQPIKTIGHKKNLVRVDVRSTPSFVANGFQRSIEKIFSRHQVAMDIVGRSEVGFSLACDQGASFSSIVCDLQHCGSVEVTKNQAIISCVGEGLESSIEGATKITNILERIDSKLNWQRVSSLNLMSVVDEDLVGPLVRRVHREIFEHSAHSN